MNNWGVTQTTQPRVPAQGNKSSKPLTEKICGGCDSGRNSYPHRRVLWRDPQGPIMYTNHPPGNQHQKGPICLWVAGEVTESQPRAEQEALFPLGPLPKFSATTQQVSCPILENTRGSTPYYVTGVPRQKIWPKWKNRSEPRKNTTKWWRDKQHIRYRAQNTGNQDASRNGWVW